MALRTVWCVDIGKSALKAALLRRDRNNVEVLAIDKIDYTAGSDGFDPGQAKEALAILHTRNEIRDPLVLIHPGQGTFMRFIKIPAFDEKKLSEMVGYEAQQQIPFPLDEVIWDYHVVDREYLSGEERDVGMFAVRREAIDDFLLDFAEENLPVEMVSVSYLALYNYAAFDLDVEEPTIVLDLGAAHTDLILMDGENFWIRQVPHRSEDITRAMMHRFKLGFAEAERLKQQMGKNPQTAAKIFQAVIQPKLRDLVQEIQRSIGYYRSQSGEAKFERVVLFGNGSKLLGITKYLREHLAMPVERARSINHIRLNREVNVKLLQSDLASFGSVFGGGLQALGVGTCNVDLVPTEEKMRKAVDRKKKHAFFAAGIVLVCILIGALLVEGKLNRMEASVLAAQEALREPNRYSASVERLEEQATTEIQKDIDFLRSVGEERNVALLGLRVLESVFRDLKNAEVVDGVVAEGDDAAEMALVDHAVQGLADQLWIPYLKVDSILYPPPREGDDARGPRRGPRRREDDANKVPAYRFQAFVVVKSGDTQTASHESLTRKFEEPLEKALALARNGGKELTTVPGVEVPFGRENLPAIYVEDPFGDMIAELPNDLPPQVGSPFYGTVATWYIVPQEVPEAGQDAEADADEDDGS